MSEELQLMRQIIEKLNRLERRVALLDAQEGGGVDASSVGAAIHGATEKVTIADNDEFGGIDSAASNVLTWWKWSTIKTTLSALYANLGVANTWTAAQTIASTTVNSHALGVTRNLDASNTTSAVAIFIQDHASDDQAVLALRQDGTGAIAELYDGATLVLRSNDGGRLDVHNIIRALSASGIRIEDDGGNLGIGVADGGRVGIGTNTPASTEADSIFTVEHSSVSAMYMSMINTGTGQVGFVLRRTGGTASRWIHYVDGGTERYAIYNGTYNGNVAAFTETGRTGFGTDSPQGKVHIDQASTTAAVPVIIADQADLSEEFVEFTSTVGVGNPIEAVGSKSLTTTHFLRVSITGVGYVYIPVGTIA